MPIISQQKNMRKEDGTFKKNTIEKFWTYVQKTDTCWTWLSNLQYQGYGTFRINGKVKMAHRISYESLKGKLTERLKLNHLCYNKRCVNPEHLEEVTQKVNCQRRLSAKLDLKKVSIIKDLYKIGKNQFYLAELFGVNQSQISRIINNKRWN